MTGLLTNYFSFHDMSASVLMPKCLDSTNYGPNRFTYLQGPFIQDYNQDFYDLHNSTYNWLTIGMHNSGIQSYSILPVSTYFDPTKMYDSFIFTYSEYHNQNYYERTNITTYLPSNNYIKIDVEFPIMYFNPYVDHLFQDFTLFLWQKYLCESAHFDKDFKTRKTFISENPIRISITFGNDLDDLPENYLDDENILVAFFTGSGYYTNRTNYSPENFEKCADKIRNGKYGECQNEIFRDNSLYYYQNKLPMLGMCDCIQLQSY
jgi:hypothetical protein